jgi:hypothetical protein
VAKVSLVAGTTSYTANIFIQDSTVTTGAGKTGLVYNTASLTAYYVRPGAAAVSITLATQTVTGAWSSGGFVEVDATNMPGVYRLDIPDAALAAGKTSVAILLKGATGMAPVTLEVELTLVNNQSATAFMTSVGSVTGAVGSVTGAVGSVTGAVGSVTGAVGSVTGNVGGNVTGSVGSVVGAVGSVTGNVGGNVTGSAGSVVGAVGSVAGNVGGNVVGSVASVTAPVSLTAGQLFIKKNTQIVVTFPMTDSTTHAPPPA